jgi:PTH1 family peptidyl-tRNA hydrolase
MKLFIGLGNPGNQYKLTRHNVGFIILDYLLECYGSYGQTFSKKFDGEFAEIRINNEKILLFKPMTYMNKSGVPSSKLVSFLKLPIDDICVIHDDLDLSPFRIKVKEGGGAGGHNGLKSLDQHIGKNYKRIRVGIGKSPFGDSSDHVLQNFFNDEMIQLEDFLPKISKHIESFWEKGMERFQSDFYI